jgi:F0F1-type ATP synthase assembly protein I
VSPQSAPEADREIGNVRRLAARILLVQVAVTVSLALLAQMAYGTEHALSALSGGGIGIVANLYMTFASLRPAAAAGQVLGRMMIGQLVKVALTVAGFLVLARTPGVKWAAAILAFIATVVVFWAVPMWSARRLPPRSLG